MIEYMMQLLPYTEKLIFCLNSLDKNKVAGSSISSSRARRRLIDLDLPLVNTSLGVLSTLCCNYKCRSGLKILVMSVDRLKWPFIVKNRSGFAIISEKYSISSTNWEIISSKR